MRPHYLPASDTGRVVWLNSFSARLGQYETALDLSPADINSVAADAAMFAYIVELDHAARQYKKALRKLRDQLRSWPVQTPMPALPESPDIGTPPSTVRSGIFNRIIMLVGRLKKHSNYSDTIGRDLNIIMPGGNTDPDVMTPDLRIDLADGFPVLRWTKGASDGIHIYVNRHDNNGFVLLRRTVHTVYTDTQPLPENTYVVTWDYKARYLIGDDETGQFSPTVSVQVMRA